jgi:2-succinyl-5-enolpyruvyl-6-hydroxy-3-cyclohexene-1-carboxylate synthase
VNASTALARVLVDELVRSGVTEVVLSPGSRNAPLSFALHAADGRLRLHVRIDERTAGFLALGLAKASGEPVAVVCTSGTAAVNLHPAVVEASHSGTPMVVLTADRPAELRGTGANQTIDQTRLYGGAVRLFRDISAAEDRAGQNAGWRSVIGRALVTARGDLGGDPGPVHLNVAFREPLVPDASPDWFEPLEGRPAGRPWLVSAGGPRSAIPYVGSPRTLVVVGHCRGDLAEGAGRLARARGWPLVAEPVSGVRQSALNAGSLLLSTPPFVAEHKPERVLVVGRPTLSRAVAALLRDPDVAVDVVTGAVQWADPSGRAELVAPAAVLTGMTIDASGVSWSMSWGPEPAMGEPAFLDSWQKAAAQADDAVQAFLAAERDLTGLHVARTLLGQLPADGQTPRLILGSSLVIRDVDLVGTWPLSNVMVVANRGAGGIDGTVSTAIGAALADQRTEDQRTGNQRPWRDQQARGHGQAYALLGDLTFLHDSTGLVIGPDEPRPDLCIVVVNDDGGSIFGLLEQGAPEHAAAFERVFGTPHGVDLGLLCAATGTPHQAVSTVRELAVALTPRPGVRVVEARVDRRGARDLHARLREAVTAALAPLRG